MQGLTVYMPDNKGDYERLLNTFKASWELNSSIPLKVIEATLPRSTDAAKSSPNVRKAELWLKHFDQDTIFIDCDMLTLSDPAIAFNQVNDIALCERHASKLPFNGGVVYARYTDYSIRYMRKFVEVNHEMRRHRSFHKAWQAKYAGTNQAAMGFMLENGWPIEWLPERFNVSNGWERYNINNVVNVHIKSRLRRRCLQNTRPRTRFELLWHEYEEKSKTTQL